jgi:hypothetical protein
MAQDIGDLLQGHTCIQHAAGDAVPEDMNACPRPAATFVGSKNGTPYDVFLDRQVMGRDVAYEYCAVRARRTFMP